MFEEIKSMLFENGVDAELFLLGNKYARLAKLDTKPAIRQLLLQVLPQRIAQLEAQSQEKNPPE